jgi:glycosyltransferase involved in cell wall biosynthesis
MPVISIILPTHNRPVLLAAALASLQAQTIGDWDAIVVDDASTPPVSLALDDNRIRVVRHSVSKGGAAAKNTGIHEASANILAFLDDDDLYAPSYLERSLGVLSRHPELDVVFMGVSWFGSAGANGQRNYDVAMAKIMGEAEGVVIEEGVYSFGTQLVEALLKSVPMAFQRPVVRREAINRIGLYRPECLLWDCDWAISAALTVKTALIQDGLYMQRVEGQGYSSRGDRKLEHLQSGIEIKERFLRENMAGRNSQYVNLFRAAIAQAWFDLAWHHYQQGNRHNALGALFESEKIRMSIGRLKLLARLLLPGR